MCLHVTVSVMCVLHVMVSVMCVLHVMVSAMRVLYVMVSVMCVLYVMAKMSVCAACDGEGVKIHDVCCTYSQEFLLKNVCHEGSEKGHTPTNTLTLVIKWTLHRKGDMSRLMVGVHTIVNS